MNTNKMTTTIKSAELNLYFTKEVDRLDFTIHATDAIGRKCTVDGFVARAWGTNRYYVNSEVLPIDFKVKKDDVFGKNDIGYFAWQQTEGHYTLKGAIKHHLEKIWGIAVENEIVPPTKLQTFIKTEATKKTVAIAMGGHYDGSKDDHKNAAKKFAKLVVENGSCFSDKGDALQHTVVIGVYNFNPTAVREMWDNLFGVEDAEMKEVA